MLITDLKFNELYAFLFQSVIFNIEDILELFLLAVSPPDCCLNLHSEYSQGRRLQYTIYVMKT